MKPILTCQRGSTRVKLLTMCFCIGLDIFSSPAHTSLIPLQREPSIKEREPGIVTCSHMHFADRYILPGFPGPRGVVWRADR